MVWFETHLLARRMKEYGGVSFSDKTGAPLTDVLKRSKHYIYDISPVYV
jgi:hypothetical protein